MITDEELVVFTEKEHALIRANNLYLARVIAIRRLRKEGHSLRKIGNAMGISHEWVRRLAS